MVGGGVDGGELVVEVEDKCGIGIVGALLREFLFLLWDENLTESHNHLLTVRTIFELKASILDLSSKSKHTTR